MTKFMMRHIVILGGLALFFACSRGSGLPKPPKPEPPGRPVELTEQDRRVGHVAKPEKREWMIWHIKGNGLKSQHKPSASGDRTPATREEIEQAIYCFHQAEAAWPKKLPEDAAPEAKRAHRPYPQDTILSKAHAYMLLGENELALHFYKTWRDLTGNALVDREIGELERRLGNTPTP